eukprot:9664018-Alexandrium_andersonii.AAC.1
MAGASRARVRARSVLKERNERECEREASNARQGKDEGGMMQRNTTHFPTDQPRPAQQRPTPHPNTQTEGVPQEPAPGVDTLISPRGNASGA